LSPARLPFRHSCEWEDKNNKFDQIPKHSPKAYL